LTPLYVLARGPRRKEKLLVPVRPKVSLRQTETLAVCHAASFGENRRRQRGQGI
jgi:hypothetical protein